MMYYGGLKGGGKPGCNPLPTIKKGFTTPGHQKHLWWDWLKGFGILRKGYHGGTYDGNACRNLLKQTGELRKVLPTNLVPLIETMVKFDAVVHSTFGMELKENSHVAISEFVDSYRRIQDYCKKVSLFKV